MAHATAGNTRGREPTSPAVANGLHAFAHAVKLHGTRRNRISSAESVAQARRVRNSPGENRGFFQNRPPPDGPRAPPQAHPAPPAAAPARDNDATARAGTPCPARSPETGVPPVAATKPSPPRHRLRYSSDPEDDRGRTTARTPSTDRSAHGNEQGLAAAATGNHAGPRTQGASTPDGQVPAAELPLRSGTL